MAGPYTLLARSKFDCKQLLRIGSIFCTRQPVARSGEQHLRQAEGIELPLNRPGARTWASALRPIAGSWTGSRSNSNRELSMNLPECARGRAHPGSQPRCPSIVGIRNFPQTGAPPSIRLWTLVPAKPVSDRRSGPRVPRSAAHSLQSGRRPAVFGCRPPRAALLLADSVTRRRLDCPDSRRAGPARYRGPAREPCQRVERARGLFGKSFRSRWNISSVSKPKRHQLRSGESKSLRHANLGVKVSFCVTPRQL